MIVLAFCRKYWREIAIALAAVWILAGWYVDHRQEQKQATLPVSAQETKRADKWPERVIPDCPAIVEKVVPEREAKRIERDFGVRVQSLSAKSGNDDVPVTAEQPNLGTVVPAPRVLGLFDVPRLTYGGEALATLNPDGHTALTFKPKGAPFLSLRPTWGFGAAVDPTAWRDRWTGYVLVEPVHFHERWHVRGTAGIDGRDGKSGAVLTVGLEFRSR